MLFSTRLLSLAIFEFLVRVSGNVENHRLGELFPYTRLDLPAAEPSDNMYPLLVDCWCERCEPMPSMMRARLISGSTHRFRTGLLDKRCQKWARNTFRWYVGMSVNTLKPTDAWLADARHYWIKEEYCEYTQP